MASDRLRDLLLKPPTFSEKEYAKLDKQRWQEEQFIAECFLREWQKVLRLQDWTITIEVVNELDNHLGHTSVWLHSKAARMEILDSKHLEVGRPFVDMDHTIVHELLHIVIRMKRAENEEYSVEEEQAIEQIAQVVVGLHRKIQPANPETAAYFKEKRKKPSEGKSKASPKK